MVKSKSKIDKVENKTQDATQYASKEEEDEFLKFSDDEDMESEDSENQETTGHNRKALDAVMSGSDEDSDIDDEEMSVNDDEEEMVHDDEEDEESNQPLDRKAARELAKVHAERNKRTVFVGNITTKVTKKVLTQLFNSKKAAGEGAVDTIRIRGAVAPDSQNAQAKRKAVILKSFADSDSQVLCAFVVLKKEEDVEKCLALNNHLLDGRHIRVDRIKGKKMNFKPTHCVFVGNLPYSVNEELVRDSFSKCGDIVNVRLIRNKTDGKVIGIGYVEFTEEMGVEFALKLNKTLKIQDRLVRIEKWTPAQTQKEKRKNPKHDDKQKGRRATPKVVVPSNMKGIEMKEFVLSKKKKLMKKAERAKKFRETKQKKTTK